MELTSNTVSRSKFKNSFPSLDDGRHGAVREDEHGGQTPRRLLCASPPQPTYLNRKASCICFFSAQYVGSSSGWQLTCAGEENEAPDYRSPTSIRVRVSEVRSREPCEDLELPCRPKRRNPAARRQIFPTPTRRERRSKGLGAKEKFCYPLVPDAKS